MPCYSKTDENGTPFVLCGSLGPHCADWRCAWVADYLCDFPVDDGKTCDRPLCEHHAYEVAENRHYCAQHYELWFENRVCGGKQLELMPVAPVD